MTSAFATAFPLVQTAGTMTRETQGTRQDDRDDASFVRTAKSADNAIQMAWRWVTILAIVIGFGVQIGVQNSRAAAMESAIRDLRSDIGEFRKINTELNIQTDRNTRDIVAGNMELKNVRDEIRELRVQVDTLRNMREAYVYDSAKAARNKLLQQATTPP